MSQTQYAVYKANLSYRTGCPAVRHDDILELGPFDTKEMACIAAKKHHVESCNIAGINANECDSEYFVDAYKE